jgi:hypothetical protein
MFLTGAQSLFAVAILANLSFSLMAAIVIFALFATQLLVPDPAFRDYYSIFYVGLAVVLVAGKKDTRDGVFGLFSRGAATEALEKR